MSIDILQKKIRKLKNPIIVDFTMTQDDIEPGILEEAGAFLPAYEKVCTELMDALSGVIPAVRFDFGCFAFFGADGLNTLDRLLKLAKKRDFYVVLKGMDFDNPVAAAGAMNMHCDGVAILPYLGSDNMRNYTALLNDSGKSLFVTLRTPNRSASEVQDLMTGSRLVHHAAADVLWRLGEPFTGKCGYTQIAGTAAANAPESIRILRSKYNRLFLLVDGYDYSNANAKNCSFAFDQFGHGAIVCSGTGVTAAWKTAEGSNVSYVDAALEAVRRMQKNILRYITVL